MAGSERTSPDPVRLELAAREQLVATEAEHVEEAERSFARGELARALEQIAAALSFAPSHPPYLELLEAIAERAAEPLALIPSTSSRFFGLEAVRARLLAREGRLGAALVALLDVVAFRPEVPYLLWAAEWIGRRPDLKGIDAAAIEARLACFVDALPSRPGPGSLDNVSVALELAERLGERRPTHRVKLLVLRAMLLRAAGCADEAEVLLGAEAAVHTDARIEAALGALATARGDLFEARSRFEHAARLAPDDASARLDLALTFALRGDALDECTAAAALTGDTEEERAVLDGAAAVRGDERARERLSALEASGSPPAVRLIARRSEEGRTRLPVLDDPVAHASEAALWRAASEAMTGPLVVRIRGGARVAPSLRAAFRAAARDLGRLGDLVSEDEVPDLKGAASEGASDEHVEALVRLAESTFDVDQWLSVAPLVEPERLRAWLVEPPLWPRADSLAHALLRWQIASLCALGSSAPDLARRELDEMERTRDAYLATSARAARLALLRRVSRD